MENERNSSARPTKQQAINTLVSLGCTIVDECKGKPTVRFSMPGTDLIIYGDARDLAEEITSLRQRETQHD